MIRFTIILSLVFVIHEAFGQATLSTKNKKAIDLYMQADNFRVRGQHAQAIELLNQAIARDKNFMEAYYRLGIVYMTTKNFQAAIENFEKGLTLTEDPRKQRIFWYDLGESYLSIGAYEEAKETLESFLAIENQNRAKIEKAKLMLNSAKYALQNSEITSQYKQRPLSDTVNHFAMQYFPVLTADQQELIFTRRLGHGPDDDEDLVVSIKNKKGQWSIPVSISDKINSELNEGTCTISADGRKIIFTSCTGRESYGSCDLYETRKIGDKWTEPVNLGTGVNSAEWESQPSLSADGRTLYFVSDRRGGYGRRDLWISVQDEKGNWTKAQNLGKQINTVFDEISPFIHVNNRTLYFASNGLTGFGGYDIFYAEKDSAGGWSKPKNLGPPINTHEDQFSLFITADGKKGYYSHEEPVRGGQSVSKIMEVEIPEQNQVRYKSNYVEGVVRDKQTGEPLSAKVELFNLETNAIESLVASDSITGEYLMVLTQGAEYALYVNKAGYLFQSLNFNYSEVKDFEPIKMDIELEKAKEGSVAVLKNIFFDVDKYDLKDKSLTELQKIARFLTENPLIKVEISGHTDNTGTETYNRQLSKKRAEAVYNYLIQNSIDQSRLSTKGYGSSHPRASNESEEGRQLNRRIEFRITY